MSQPRNLVSTVSEEATVKRLRFVFSLYGMQYEENVPFSQRLKGLKNRTLFPKDREVTKAVKTSRKVAENFSLTGALPIFRGDKRRVKDVLENYADDISTIIRDPTTNSCKLATRSFRFLKQWNETIQMVEGQFLQGFGDLFPSELYISDSESLINFLIKLRKARVVPEELDILHKKPIQKVIVAKIVAVETYAKALGN